MSVPAQFSHEFADFPAALRELVEAELAAGNEIVEISSGFPAPPAGACLKLARNIVTRPRESGGGLDFYERRYPGYLSEITDGKRHFFVLEPPAPPEPEPDMDAIRAERQARYAASMAERINTPCAPHTTRPVKIPTPAAPATDTGSALARFLGSMEMNYERWHDGTGYDLQALSRCTAEEREEIERLLTNKPAKDWRDIEALAALDTPQARARLRQAMLRGDHRMAMAVLHEAPALISDAERTAALVAALESCDIYGGLTQALNLVEDCHPPQVIEALLRGALNGSGEKAVHFAAMLMFLHGKAKEAFDWEHRPFFLRFNTNSRHERETAFRELCERIGVPSSG